MRQRDVIPLTHALFSEFVQAHEYALVHFGAKWNGYDAQMQTLLEAELPAEVRDVVALGTLDVDPPEHHEICRQHKILNIPFLAFYRNGTLIGTVTGLQRQEILERLRQLIGIR